MDNRHLKRILVNSIIITICLAVIFPLLTTVEVLTLWDISQNSIRDSLIFNAILRGGVMEGVVMAIYLMLVESKNKMGDV